MARIERGLSCVCGIAWNIGLGLRRGGHSDGITAKNGRNCAVWWLDNSENSTNAHFTEPYSCTKRPYIQRKEAKQY